MLELPNVDRLKQLPLRALVAYAVRCAMRVQLLYLKWQDGEEKTGSLAGMAESVAEAIELASKFAAQQGEYDLKRGLELEETVIQAVMRAKEKHRGAAFAANSAYAALNAANLASTMKETGNRPSEAEKVVLAATTAADAASAAHEPVTQPALDDWSALQLMRIGKYPELGSPVDPSPNGKLGALMPKKPKLPSWKDQSATLRQVKKSENVLEQTRDELRLQQEERKKDKTAHEAKCDEYEKTIRHLKAEVIPLKREREDLAKENERLQAELDAIQGTIVHQNELHSNRLKDLANQLLVWAHPMPDPTPAKAEESIETVEEESPESVEPVEQPALESNEAVEQESSTTPVETVTC